MTRFNSSKRIGLRKGAPQVAPRQTRLSGKLAGTIIICSALLLLPAQPQALADITFNNALDTQLDGVTLPSTEFEPCVRLVGGDPNARDGSGVPIGFGPELTAICSRISPQGSSAGVGASGASAGGGVTATVPVVEERQRKLREEEKEGEDAGGDAEISLGSGVSAFFSAKYGDLDRDQTAFEDGYDSDGWGLTLGADYLVNNLMVAGLALNLNRWDGDYDTGGGFDTDSWGATAFASFLPWKRLFIDVAVGYARNDISEDRRRFYIREEIPDINDPNTTVTQVFGGRTDADRDDDMWSASLRLGYDFPINRFTIGPRFALDWRYTEIDGYTEEGRTGLELKYQEDSRTLLQSKLGLQALMPISTGIGVFMPQVYGRWVHEFADKQRSISVQFVQDLRANPTRYSFDTDDPDMDWWEFGAGVVFVMPRGYQAFINVETLQSHKFLDSTAGSAGLRVVF